MCEVEKEAKNKNIIFRSDQSSDTRQENTSQTFRNSDFKFNVTFKQISVPPSITSQISLVCPKKPTKSRPLLFQTDSDWIGIDTFSTYCLTNNISDFYENPTRCNHQVLGVSSVPTSITHKGEVKYIVTDYQGSTHALRVPEMYYCPGIPYRVLSPQSLDKQWRTHRIGTSGSQLFWGGRTVIHTDLFVDAGMRPLANQMAWKQPFIIGGIDYWHPQINYTDKCTDVYIVHYFASYLPLY
jgi:hypothetical protein